MDTRYRRKIERGTAYALWAVINATGLGPIKIEAVQAYALPPQDFSQPVAYRNPHIDWEKPLYWVPSWNRVMALGQTLFATEAEAVDRAIACARAKIAAVQEQLDGFVARRHDAAGERQEWLDWMRRQWAKEAGEP